ncbi:MAG: hypothetical protein KF688_18540 [Pirellulales bacterium]|nr:hypothetical protein [Pirellulales bacterium]
MSSRAKPASPVDRAGALRRVRGRVAAVGLGYGAPTAALLAAGALAATTELIRELQTRRAAAPDVMVRFGDALQSRSDLAAAFGGLACAGCVVGLGGHLLLRRAAGPERRLAHGLVAALFLAPLLLGGLGTIAAAMLDPRAGYVSACLSFAVAGGGLTLECSVILATLLHVAVRTAERRVVPVEDRGAGERAERRGRYEAELAELGLTEAGSFRYVPGDNHEFRAWRCESFPMYVYAARYRAAGRWIDYLAAASWTSDGRHFETTNAPEELGGAADDAAPFYHRLAAAGLVELISWHRAKVEAWLERTGAVGLDLRPEDVPAAEAYGLDHVARVLRATGRRWLFGPADPHVGFPPPPLPGRPWRATPQPEFATTA